MSGRRSPLPADGIDFVDEDDGRRPFFGGSEELSDAFGAGAYEDLVEFRSGGVEERDESR